MKKYILLLFLLAASLPAFSQHFDWVKSYLGTATNSGSNGNKIIGTDVDSDGNVYVIGEFTSGAQINGIDLLPMNPYGIQNKTINVVIAKLSPDGELLWHKAIHSNGGFNTRAIGIQCVGDSSIICMANCSLPTADNYTFFLDTLLTDWESASYLMETDSIMGAAMTSVLQFSIDGQLNNRHFLSISYIDSSGQDITGDRLFADAAMYASRYVNSTLPVNCFTVDDNGNIILSRQVSDRIFLYCDTCAGSHKEWSTSNGLIQGFKILINGGVKQLVYQTPSYTSNNNCQILKFSPHFDSLIASAYYFSMQSGDTIVDKISFYPFHSIKTDRKGRVYLSGTIMVDAEFRDAFSLSIPNSDDLTLDVQEANNTTGFLIQYDNRLVPQRIAQLRGVNNNSQFNMNSVFHCMNFDEDSNVVILIDVGKTTNDTNDGRYFWYDTTRLDVGITTCFLRIDTAWNYLTSGQINSQSSTELSKRAKQYDIVVKNNRIMAQVRYWNGLSTIDSTYTTSGRSHGLITWDYDGHCISFIDYHSPSPNTEMGGTILKDSVIYVYGSFDGGATLQNFSVPNNGYNNAYVAKYTDTAFMFPYVHTGDPGEVNITLVEGGNAFMAYPNPFRQSVKIRVESGALKVESGVVTAYLTDMQGRREEVRLTPAGNGKYTLDLTSRPQATYLLTLTTATGKTHTIRLLKQSELFGK